MRPAIMARRVAPWFCVGALVLLALGGSPLLSPVRVAHAQQAPAVPMLEQRAAEQRARDAQDGATPPGGAVSTPAYQLPVMQQVAAAGGGLMPGWADRSALNQFECANYRVAAMCAMWRAVDCSAAALDWLLGACGIRLGGIDDAINLIGPNTGISASIGLLDSTGRPLARALATEHLVPRNAQLHSPAELRTWLQQGPVALDGHLWFGEGHWFVAIGSDDGGIFIRDSSGHDVRYLTWARLYGEVGWSGWTVGVAAA